MATALKISFGFLTGNLFGSMDDIDAIDTDASIRRYADLCKSTVRAKYPNAEVIVDWQDGEGSLPAPLKTLAVDGDDERHDVAVTVDEICGRVFEAGEWYVQAVN